MDNKGNLKQKTFDGVIWSYINRFGMQLLQLIPTMLFARLLTPTEFGIIAASTLVISLLNVFADSGFGMALIQKKELKSIDISSVFYFNIFISCLLYIILFFTSSLVADFFQIPELSIIIRVSSLSVIISSLGNTQGNLFKKNLEFKNITIRNLISFLVAAIVSITLAYCGWSYWALVMQGLIQATMLTIINWYYSKWKPALEFSYQSLKQMFGFGSKLLIKNLTDFGFNKLYDIVIAKFYTPADLSYYNRAYQTTNLFTDTFLSTLNNVAYPSFSKMQSEFDRLKNNVIRFLKIEVLLISFIMLMALVLAEPIFRFLYSSKWDVVIPLFQILCVWGMFRPVSVVLANGLMAYGHSGACMKNSIVGRSISIILLLLTWEYGLKIMIFGQLLAYIIEMFLYVISFVKVFNYKSISLIKNCFPNVIISILSCLVVGIVDFLFTHYTKNLVNSEFIVSIIRLLIGVITGIICFLRLNNLTQIDTYIDFRNIILDVTKGNQLINKLVTKFL